MKPITTFVHGILDYTVGLALFAAPYLFGFVEVGGAAVWVPQVAGTAVILMSLLTRYELGVVKALPMRGHLAMDYVVGLVLLASPWVFGFADEPVNVWMPHVVAGLLSLVVPSLTQTVPDVARR